MGYALIERGRLANAITDGIAARRLGLPLRPPALAPSCLEMSAGLRLSLWDCQAKLLVLSFAGLHMQDRARGDFTLEASSCLLLGNGETIGPAKAILAGNFFDILRHPTTHLVEVPGEQLPGLGAVVSVRRC